MGNIKSIEDNHSSHNSFRRICSMACVDDGDIGEDEIDELLVIGQKYYNLSEDDVREIIDDCNENNINNEYLFYDIPERADKKVTDLYNSVKLIYADYVVTENEKEAFFILLTIYGIADTKYHEDVFNYFKRFHVQHKSVEDVVNDDEFMAYFQKCVNKCKRIKFNKHIVKRIVDKFKYKKIEGPMLMGAKNYLIYNVNEYKYRTECKNIFYTKIAIFVFLLASAILYIGTVFRSEFLNLLGAGEHGGHHTAHLILEGIFAAGILGLLLSIEWLIFMKEKIHEERSNEEDAEEKKSMTTMLIVLVAIAVVIDMSFGMLELGFDGIKDGYKVVIKLCSAIFLGGLCFYVGKCLELLNDHIEQDNSYMNRQINELNKIKQYHTKNVMSEDAEVL